MTTKNEGSMLTSGPSKPKQLSTESPPTMRWLAILTLLPFAMLIVTGYGSLSWAIPPSPASEATALSTQGAAPDPDALRIEVTLDEFSISPSPLRIPAGRPVTLVITNIGQVPHEFMAGHESQGDDFAHDLFAGLEVEIAEAANTEPVGEHEHEHAEEHEPAGEHVHSESQAGVQEHAEDEHADHADGHEHGTMVELDAGQTFHMSFTLPESRRGQWSTACFLAGHYAAGMHGTLMVE